ncbi:MAG: tetratricopeptide repeat protein [Chitinophagales bacterium]|nr:tetratricopeptide repeat protein [Chitinophagales bacterium]
MVSFAKKLKVYRRADFFRTRLIWAYRAFVLCIGLWSAPAAHAQQSIADSLAKLLQKNQPDTHRVSLLVDLAWEISSTNTDSAENCLQKAIQLARASGFIKGEGSAWNGMGVVAEERGQLDSAIVYYTRAQQIREKLGDKLGVASLYNNLGNVYEMQGRYDEALKAHRTSLRIAENEKDTSRIARSHLNIGGVMENAGLFQEAHEEVNKARLILEQLGDKPRLAGAYTLLGHLRLELEMHQEAQRWYRSALSLREQLGNEDKIAASLSDLGVALDKLEKPDSSRLAVAYFQRALNIRKKLDDPTGMAAVYNNLGEAHKHLGEYNTAISYLQKARDIYLRTKDRPGLMEVYNTWGDVLARQGSYAEALGMVQQYSEIAEETRNERYILRSYKDFAKIYAGQNDWEKAYDYQVKYDKMRFEKLNEASLRTFEQREVLYSEGKKDLEIERQKQILLERDARLARNKTFNAYLIGSAIALALLLAWFFNRSRIRARANRELAAKNELIERERQRADQLLTNILPEQTARELMVHNSVQPVRYESVTVLFTDFKGFTQIAENLSPEDLVAELDECFRRFDAIVLKYGLEKIKTIGDSYMCAGGLPLPNETHPFDAVQAALEMQATLGALSAQKQREGKPFFTMRIGIHTGPVVAGVVGSHKFAYDIWGDTVNTAARMEQSGEPGKINLSGATHALVKNRFPCTFRGKISAKNKGEIAMYFVD